MKKFIKSWDFFATAFKQECEDIAKDYGLQAKDIFFVMIDNFSVSSWGGENVCANYAKENAGYYEEITRLSWLDYANYAYSLGYNTKEDAHNLIHYGL